MIKIDTGSKVVKAEIADSILGKFLGMRFRSSGRILFDFSRDTRARIDMLFVREPLQLVFLDSEKKVIDVQEAEPWTLNPRSWRFYRPEEEYRYLLESFDPLDLEQGDRLEFEI